MKFGFRKPNVKSSIKARTTGRAKRAVKKAVIPTYGKKGTGALKDPKKAAYNTVYKKTTFDTTGAVKRWITSGSSSGKTGGKPKPKSSTKTKSASRSQPSRASARSSGYKIPKPLPPTKPYGTEHRFSIGEKSWISTRGITRATISNPSVSLEDASGLKRKPYVNVFQGNDLVFQVQARSTGYAMLLDRINEPISSITIAKKQSKIDLGHYYEITICYKK